MQTESNNFESVTRDAAWKMSDIYLEDRYETPKFGFKIALAMIEEHFPNREDLKTLDVGTAEAAFPHFLSKFHPKFSFEGVEFDPNLVALAQKNVKTCQTRQGDANDLNEFASGSYDLVTCMGVISIFDDFRPSVSECLRVAKDKGLVLINNMWNAFPVDLQIKVRHSTPKGENRFDDWQAGWNMVSIETISNFLEMHPRVASFDFTKVVLPYDISPNTENCIRSWTNVGPDGERYHMNGTGRLLDKRMLRIRLK